LLLYNYGKEVKTVNIAFEVERLESIEVPGIISAIKDFIRGFFDGFTGRFSFSTKVKGLRPLC